MNDVNKENNFNIIVEQIISHITETLDNIVPFKRKTIKYSWQNKPWISNLIINTMKQRDKAFKVAKISKQINDMDNYKKLRNKVVCMIREGKKNHYEHYIDNNKKDPKKMWITLKQLIGDKRKNRSEINEIQFADEVVIDNKLIANKMNKYFINSIETIVDEIDSNICRNSYAEIEYDYVSLNKWEIFDRVEYNMIDNVIKELDCKKGSKNEINAKLVKLIWKVKSDVIIFMINNSSKLGLVPQQ